MLKIPLIYFDSDVVEFQFNQINIEFDNSNNLKEFLQLHCDYKISCYHVPFPSDTSWLERFNSTYQQSQLTFVFCSELHDSTVEQLISVDKDNVVLLICGTINYEFKSAKVYQWMDWFVTTTSLYQQTNLLEKLNPYQSKTKYFDVLLGQPREHREYIKNHILKSNLDNDVILTYIKSRDPLVQLPASDWIWEDDVTNVDPMTKYTVSKVNYHNHNVSISQIIPISIYNKTAYTLVAETNFSNHYSFYTEKIVKPILAKRLFLVASGQYYLKNIRQLGFKTFDSIVDESYDDIADHTKRFDMVMEQMQYLINCSQEDILDKIKPITEHNQQLMLSQKWSTDFQSSMQDLVAYKDQ